MSSRDPAPYARALKAGANILLLLVSGAAALAQALPEDRDQPIHITADKALRDEKQGVTIYSGNVHMVQGSMELEADKLTIYHTSEDANEMIAEGRPAKMRQKPAVDKAIVNAHAETIHYFRAEDKVHLQTNASIEQEGAVVEGDSIEYLIAKQLITAESDKSQKGNKVVVVIPPNVQQQQKEEHHNKEEHQEGDSGATKGE
jgi:lipopolysaccharide export system protein LptA